MDYYRSLHASVLAFCKRFATQNPTIGLQTFDFDAHTQIEEMPLVPVIGPAEYSLDVDDGMLTVSVVIGISLVQDENLFTTRSLIGSLLKQLLPNATMPLYDADTGAPQVGNMIKVMNGTKVMPISITKSRPLCFIGVTLGVNLRVQP